MLTAGIIAAGLAGVCGGATMLHNSEARIEALAGSALALIGCFITGAGFFVTFAAGGF